MILLVPVDLVKVLAQGVSRVFQFRQLLLQNSQLGESGQFDLADFIFEIWHFSLEIAFWLVCRDQD